MKNLPKFAWLLPMVLIPLIAIAFRAAPEGNTWALGSVTLIDNYTGDWPTTLWLISLALIPWLVGLLLFFVAPRKFLSWPVQVILGQLVFIFSWQLVEIFQAVCGFDESGFGFALVYACICTGLAFFYAHWRKPTLQEENDKLLRMIDQLQHEDLPFFFRDYNEFNHLAETMGDKEVMEAWKPILKKKGEEGNIHVLKTLRKLEELRA